MNRQTKIQLHGLFVFRWCAQFHRAFIENCMANPVEHRPTEHGLENRHSPNIRIVSISRTSHVFVISLSLRVCVCVCAMNDNNTHDPLLLAHPVRISYVPFSFCWIKETQTLLKRTWARNENKWKRRRRREQRKRESWEKPTDNNKIVKRI